MSGCNPKGMQRDMTNTNKTPEAGHGNRGSDTSVYGSNVSTTPLKEIRKRCVYCSETLAEVRNCTITHCTLHPYRMGRNPFYGKEKPADYHPPLKAIRLYCLDCCCGSYSEVKKCGAAGGSCNLFAFRFGKNPYVSDAKRKASQKSILSLKKGLVTDDFQANTIQEGVTKGLGVKSKKTWQEGGEHG